MGDKGGIDGVFDSVPVTYTVYGYGWADVYDMGDIKFATWCIVWVSKGSMLWV